jgi:hypothetical protein
MREATAWALTLAGDWLRMTQKRLIKVSEFELERWPWNGDSTNHVRRFFKSDDVKDGLPVFKESPRFHGERF